MQEHDALVELARPTDRRRVVVAIKPVGPCQHHVGLRQLEKAYLERRQSKAIEFAAHRVIRPVKLRREVGGGDVILLEPDQRRVRQRASLVERRNTARFLRIQVVPRRA